MPIDEPLFTDAPKPPPRRTFHEHHADREHLKLLAVFHFVLAGVVAFFSCFAFIHVALGIAIATGSITDPNGPPREVGWIFAGLGGLTIAIGWTFAFLTVLAGRRLIQHRSRVYCMVVAAVMCLGVPFGTVLGVFTLVVLSRPTVRELFDDA